MTDIISRAQELVELRASMDKSSLTEVLKVMYEESGFAPALTEALAEEKWEFTAQVYMYNRSWVFMWSRTSGNSVYGKWHHTRELAEDFAEQWQLDYPVRIVRRRVSPMEEA